VRALICGVGGQDGAYLAQLLLSKGYEVWGTSRDAQINEFRNLEALQLRDRVHLVSMAPTDFRSVSSVFLRAEPTEVYYLAGQSSVGLSFEQPLQTLESVTMGSLHMLEAIRTSGWKTKLYHASSSECFGDVGAVPAHENTLFQPRSPYAVAKAAAHWMMVNYRKSYDVFACNGIFFNHESPFRPSRFVTRKIADSAIRIAAGSKEKLVLGRLDIVRDWGWAPEYVEAMWLILQQDEAADYVVATGKSVSLREFVKESFATVGLDWTEHVEQDPTLHRPSDIARSAGDPTFAHSRLGWEARTKMPDVARMLTRALEST
jgi:GDPmannose 4,6-dehydratase